jgi:hypothetical protein
MGLQGFESPGRILQTAERPEGELMYQIIVRAHGQWTDDFEGGEAALEPTEKKAEETALWLSELWSGGTWGYAPVEDGEVNYRLAVTVTGTASTDWEG